MKKTMNKKKVSISESLITSFHLWKSNFLLIALVITIVFIPIQILIEFTSMIFVQVNGPNNFETAEDLRRFSNEARVYSFIRQLFSVIATLGIYNYIYSIIRIGENKENVFNIVKFGIKRWPVNFIETLIAGIITFLYTLLLIIPGIYKAVQFCFISNLVADEESDPQTKSKLLVKENWFDVFWMLILMFLIGLIVEVIVVIPFMFLPSNYILSILLGILAAIATSYTIIFKGVYYCNLKKLKMEVTDDLINSEIEQIQS